MWNNELAAVHSGGRTDKPAVRAAPGRRQGWKPCPAYPNCLCQALTLSSAPTPISPSSRLRGHLRADLKGSSCLRSTLPGDAGIGRLAVHSLEEGRTNCDLQCLSIPRYKYSQQGQFQAPDMMPLTAEWRRGSCLLLYSSFTMCL